jgi:hypothetical protein
MKHLVNKANGGVTTEEFENDTLSLKKENLILKMEIMRLQNALKTKDSGTERKPLNKIESPEG